MKQSPWTIAIGICIAAVVIIAVAIGWWQMTVGRAARHALEKIDHYESRMRPPDN